MISLSKKQYLEKIEGKLFIETLSTTLLPKICELMFRSKVIFRSMTGPDDTRQIDLQAQMG